MASPTDTSRTPTNVSTAADPWSVNLPGSIASGDTLLMFVRLAGAQTMTVPSGWTAIKRADGGGTDILNDVLDASNDAVSAIWRKADGTEGATQSVDMSSTVKGVAIVYRITGAADPTVSVPVASNIATSGSIGIGTGANADPAIVTPPGGSADYLFVVCASLDGEDPTQTLTAAPTSYSNFQAANSGTASTAATNCIMGSGSRQLTASSEDPGTFTSSAPAGGWTAFTVAVYPSAGVSGAVVTPFSFGEVVSGRLGAKAQLVTPFTLGEVITGKLTAKARVDSPFTFGRVTNGTRVLRGQVVTPFTFGVFTDGTAETGGPAPRVVLPFSFGRVVSGTTTRLGRVDSPFTFGRVVASKVTAKAQLVTPFTFGRVVNGTRVLRAFVVTPFSFNRVITGKLTAKQRVAFPITFGVVAEAQSGSTGRVVLPITFGRVTAGTALKRGRVDLPLAFGEVTQGKRTGRGIVVSPFTLGQVVTGYLSLAHGVVGLVLLVDAVTEGTVESRLRRYVPKAAGRINVGTLGHIDDGDRGVIEEVLVP